MSQKYNQKLFEEIYNSTFKRIYYYVYQRVPRKEDVDDIVAEVYAALWQNIEQIDQNANIMGFLYRIGFNKINDFLRKIYKVERNSENFEEESIESFSTDNLTPNQDKAYKQIESLISELNERDQLLYKLKYQQKLKSSEIATILGITKNNVKVANNRLIKKLKELKELWNQKK